MEVFAELSSQISPKFTWDVFRSVLQRESKSDKVQLISIEAGEGVKKGDSYLSTVTRFTVHYTGDINEQIKSFKLHVIAKALLKNVAQRKTFRSFDFFKNEICFYEKVWPALNDFQNEMKAKEQFGEIPKYLCGYYDGENDYILLEDLSFQGYSSFSRSTEMSLDNVKRIMKLFAHFHALGVALRHSNKDKFEQVAHNLQETYFSEKFRSWYIKFQDKLKSISLDAVQKEIPECYEKLASAFKHDIYSAASEVCCSSTSKYTTITHGDVWIANFLVRYDESMQPLHSVMIDFQLSRRASLAQDISFFIYSCTSANFRSQHYEEILKFYCDTFNVFYAQIYKGSDAESNLLSVDILKSEFKSNAEFTLSMCMEAIIMSMLDDDEVSDLEEMKGEEPHDLETVWIVKPLQVKEKRQRLAQFIKHMIDNQYF